MTSDKQPKSLISILVDPLANLGDRDDAAMNLSSYDEPEVEQALSRIACNNLSDEELVDTCGESLAEIWCRKNRINEGVLKTLREKALTSLLATMAALCPSLALKARAVLQE